MKESPSSQSPEQVGCIGFALRSLWLMVGNVGLAVVAIFIILNHPPLFSLYDLLFWAIAVLLVIVRYIDIAYFHGGDSYGDPATMKHWRRYAALLLVISLAMWSIAHGVVYYFYKQ
jgi:hypothetical protein